MDAIISILSSGRSVAGARLVPESEPRCASGRGAGDLDDSHESGWRCFPQRRICRLLRPRFSAQPHPFMAISQSPSRPSDRHDSVMHLPYRGSGTVWVLCGTKSNAPGKKRLIVRRGLRTRTIPIFASCSSGCAIHGSAQRTGPNSSPAWIRISTRSSTARHKYPPLEPIPKHAFRMSRSRVNGELVALAEAMPMPPIARDRAVANNRRAFLSE